MCLDLPAPDECLLLFYVIGGEDGSMAFAATGDQHVRNAASAAALGLLDRASSRRESGDSFE